jgi:hypothetical protein
MRHVLAPIAVTETGYESRCSCGRVYKHAHRDGIEGDHQRHEHLADLREQLEKGKAK